MLYGDLCALYTKLLLELEKPPTHRDKQKVADQLTKLRLKNYKQELLAKTVQDRITRHYNQLLVCLDYEDVLPENNTAERTILPQVILRKIFSGSRSPEGAKTHAVNTSVITTQLAQNPNKNFFEVMLPLVQRATY